MTNQTLWALVAALIVHVLVVAQVWLSDAATTATKMWKTCLVVALPFVGAIVVLLTEASKRMNPRA
jgi:phosphoglycerol transferase MdoB-like AlkP superfamily enzyme